MSGVSNLFNKYVIQPNAQLLGGGVSKVGTAIDTVLPGSPAATAGGWVAGPTGGLSETIKAGGKPTSDMTFQGAGPAGGGGGWGGAGQANQTIPTNETQANTNNTLNNNSSSVNYGLVNAYDQQIQTLLNAANSLQSQKSAQETMASGNYNQSLNDLSTQYAKSRDSLNEQAGKIKVNKSQSLGDLAESGRNALQAFSNQLGALGAGSSSAVGLGQYALARQQARAGMDLNRQYGEQQHQVDTGLQGLENSFATSKRDLDQAKQNKLLEIAQTYKNVADQINSQMATANEARRQALGGINQQAAAQVAAQVAALEAQYNSQLQNLQNTYGSITYNPNLAAVTNTDNYAKFVNDPAIDATLTPEQQQQQISAVYAGVDPNKEQQPLYLN